MCFHSQQTKTALELKKRFKAEVKENETIQPSIYNGFEFPKTPIIIDKEPNVIQHFNWGLLPSWTKDINFRTNTLNAKIETLNEKPSFKPYLVQRCLIIADGFFEWQWLDVKGKNKQQYKISLTSNEAFAFAGLYNNWINTTTNETINTYTIITTEANELMSEIHNSKKRMPLILNPNDEQDFLSGKSIPVTEINLKAEKLINPNKKKEAQLGFDFGE